MLSILLGSFLVFHLWSFDRFKCLKWNNGPYSGAFKRVMTYTYLLSIPLLITYAVGFAIIKYHAGFVFIPGYGVQPTPWQMWGSTAKSAILPLYLMFSIAWSFEMVTHLEELCFWLFLVNAGSAQQDWFRSLYFKTWLVGSTVACLYMPLVTIFTRSDPLKCEAYTFLAGSLGSLSLTLWFTPVLWTFPAFLKNLRREGVDKDTVVRLTKFHELNTLRVVFRFLFCLPLVALGIDGVRPHQHVNENMMAVDILAMVSAVGCVVSSAITLVIFFPRSIEGEMAAKQLAREKRSRTGGSRTISRPASIAPSHINAGGTYLLTASPVRDTFNLPPDTYPPFEGTPSSPEKYGWATAEYERNSTGTRDSQATAIPSLPLRPNRREPDTPMSLATLSEENIIKHNRRQSKHNHLVYNYTSPIDLAYAPRPLDIEEQRR